MSNFDEFVTRKLSDPMFMAEYDALEPEFAIIHAMIEARKTSGFTQSQLSRMADIPQDVRDREKMLTG